MKHKAPLAHRRHDLYEPHPVAVDALLRVEALPRGELWKPACGRRATVRVLRGAGHRVLATDLVDHHSPDQDTAHRDFFLETELPPSVEIILTSPPFKEAARFAARALSSCPKVIPLLRLSFLESGTERSAVGRARLSVFDGGHLARVHVFRNRLPAMRDGWTGNRVSNPTPFAWFVWDRDPQGRPALSRISWTATPPARTAATCGPDWRQPSLFEG